MATRSLFSGRLIIPVAALIGLGMTTYVVVAGGQEYTATPPIVQPPTSPFAHTVAGSGLLEPSTQNISVGTPLPGIVSEIKVEVGQVVAKGDPLFVIDDTQVQADLKTRQAALGVAEARLPSAVVQQGDAAKQLVRVQSIEDARAISKEEVQRRETMVRSAQARVDEAKAQVVQARAEIQSMKTLLERHVVRAPIDGEVLQLNVRPGEYAVPGTTPPVIMGDTRTMAVRVNIDENEAWRIEPKAEATGFLRGNTAIRIPLQWLRVEPLVIPKRSLTGESAERVDTRVLQVLLTFPKGAYPVYVGQQMDVYVGAKPVPNASLAAGTVKP